MNNAQAFERLTMDTLNAIRDSVRPDLTPAGRDFELICAAYSAGFSAGNRAPRLTDPEKERQRRQATQERAAARRRDALADARRQEREAKAAHIRQKYGFTRQERPRKTAQDAPHGARTGETAEKA